MKATYILLFATLLMVSCSKNQTPKEQVSLHQSCQKLSDIVQKRTTDTLKIKEVLTDAYRLAEQQTAMPHDSLIAVVSQLWGRQLEIAKNYAEARFFYKTGMRFGLRQLPKDAFSIAKLYRNIGTSFYNEDNFKTALTYFDSVKTMGQDSASWVLKTQNQIATADCFYRLKNLKAAEYLYQEVIPLTDKYFSDKEKTEFFYRYSYFLREIKQFKQSVDVAQKGVNILEALARMNKVVKADSMVLANLYYCIGFALQDSTAYKPSEKAYLKALSLYKTLNNMDNYRRGLMNMGLMYRYDKRFEKAEAVLTEGITLLDKEEQSDLNIVRKGKLFINRSEVFGEVKQFAKALADQDSAIYYLTLYDKRASLTAILMSTRRSLLSVYADKAKIYSLFAENGSDTDGSSRDYREGYQKSLIFTQKLIELTDDIRADYFSDDAKLSLANDIKPALEKAIGVCQKLYQKTQDTTYLNKAFAFVEYSRSMVLYENARLDNQLPPNLKAENADLKKREAALIAKNNVEELQNYLRLKRQFREKIKSLNHNQLASVATLQKALLPNNKTALLEFFVGDSTIFVFTMLQNDLKLSEIPKPKDFEKQIETFRQGITQARPVREATAFGQQSAQLYALLLRGVSEQMPTTISQFIIAPDGVLSYLPFELLIKTDNAPTDFRKVEYLLKHYAISYAYSANLLLEQKRIKKDKTSQLFAGFASKYENKDTLNLVADVSRAILTRDNAYELKGAKEEVAAISQIMNGKAFSDELATEGVFKREANQYRILHFAMHSLTNDEEPMLSKLLFTLTPQDTTNDNDLTAAELYTMNLNADLAVLSACNTGYGKISKGEGVMSLARAFTYAGVPATVTSLWKVPDLTTREIMESFYKNLKSGMTKDAALREAKLTYLNNAPESIAANPYFWAGFVPMGNMDAMDMTEKGPLSIFWIFGGLLAISGLVFYFLKKQKAAQKRV